MICKFIYCYNFKFYVFLLKHTYRNDKDCFTFEWIEMREKFRLIELRSVERAAMCSRQVFQFITILICFLKLLTAAHLIRFTPPHLSKYSVPVFIRAETSVYCVNSTFQRWNVSAFERVKIKLIRVTIQEQKLYLRMFLRTDIVGTLS